MTPQRTTPPRPHLRRAPGALTAAAVLLGGWVGLDPAAADPSFAPLLGSWGGSGTYQLHDGTSERLRCDAYYTGGGAQLGIAVRCAGETNRIEMRSKLSASGTALSGNWEERTYNAEGTVTGKLSETELSLAIGGGISGSMKITFDRTRQNVAIATEGIPLKSVTVSLSRK